MSILFLGSTLFLFSFMILALYDGIYLHLWKFELFRRKESALEHNIHTLRAVLFPIIVYFIFIDTSKLGFCLGISFFLLDLIVLAYDAFVEEDSRNFMNGLPRWEYILHLFANSFHFASFILLIFARLIWINNGIEYSESYLDNEIFWSVHSVAINILSGSIILAIIHIALISKQGQQLWLHLKSKVACC